MNELKSQLETDGFCVLPHIYTEEETAHLLRLVAGADTSATTFRRSEDLFAVRQFLKTIPETVPVVFNEQLQHVIRSLFGKDYFAVKSIWFDKPASSNWFVPWHQDLTISADKKILLNGYGPWTVKQDQFAVQPPLSILENGYTVRIHLDETDERNGALKVIPGSHRKGIYRPEMINWSIETEVTCCVPKGGIMIMKPLLLHSSGKTTNDRRRRVVHIEFSNIQLPEGLAWAEYLAIKALP
jgi:ectoine hydroxylase-related dioxygenase (phytanoyl-CoA dioxygenase family)